MTSIALDKDEMNALEEWLETDVNPRPPCLIIITSTIIIHNQHIYWSK